MRHAKVALLFLMSGLVLTGCVAHSTSPLIHDSSGSVPATTQPKGPAFEYERKDVPFRNHVLDADETPTYRVRHIRFPSVGTNGQPENLVEGKYYESKLAGAKPLIVVLPIWGGHTYPAEKMTEFMKRHGDGSVNIFMMLGRNFIIDWESLAVAPDEETFMEAWRRSAAREETMFLDIRRIVDWAEIRAEVDPEKVGLLGFSHGAMVASAIVMRDPRVDAAVLMMPGALIHQVLARCPLGRSEGMRTQMSEVLGWTTAELEQRIEPIFRPLDPVTYPGLVDPSRVLFIDATKDECMHQAGRDALWEALGRPERIQLPYKHQRAFLAMTPVGLNWLRYRVWDFFEEAFTDSVSVRH